MTQHADRTIENVPEQRSVMFASEQNGRRLPSGKGLFRFRSTIKTRMLVLFLVTVLLPGVLIISASLILSPERETALPMVGTYSWISLLSVFVAMGLAYHVTDTILKPLSQVVEAAAEIADGNLDVTVPVGTADETGQLATAVNQMTARLRMLVGGLEERVAARTADLARRSAQLETAARVAREAASIRDVNQLLQSAVDQIAKQFGLYHVGLYLVDSASRTVMLRASSAGGGESLIARGFRMDLDGAGIIAQAASAGRPQLVRDVNDATHYVALAELPNTRSEMSLPLRIRDEVIGVLDVQSEQTGFFGREDLTYLQTLADQISLALENAMLLEESEVRLREIGRLVAAQQQDGWKRLTATRPNWAYVFDGFEARPLANESSPVQASDLVLPLGGIDGRFGTVRIRPPSERAWTPAQLSLAEAITEEASSALERARLFGDTQDALVEVETLYRSSWAVVAAKSLQGILGAIADNAVTPGVDRLLLILPDSMGSDGQARMHVSAALDAGGTVPDVLGRVWSESVFPVLGWLRDGTLEMEDITSDVTLDDLSRKVFLQDMGTRSAWVTPLRAGQQFVGWLVIGSTDQLHTFSEGELRVYGGLTDLIASVVSYYQLVDLATNRAERAQALGTISSRMRETLDMDLILQTSLREIGEKLGVANIEVLMHGGTPEDVGTPEDAGTH